MKNDHETNKPLIDENYFVGLLDIAHDLFHSTTRVKHIEKYRKGFRIEMHKNMVHDLNYLILETKRTRFAVNQKLFDKVFADLGEIQKFRGLAKQKTLNDYMNQIEYLKQYLFYMLQDAEGICEPP